MNPEKRYLARIADLDENPPAHGQTLIFGGDLVYHELSRLLRATYAVVRPEQPLTRQSSSLRDGFFYLSPAGTGTAVFREPIGGTLIDATDYHLYLLLEDDTLLTCTVGEGYLQPPLTVTVRSPNPASLEGLAAALIEHMAAAGCPLTEKG